MTNNTTKIKKESKNKIRVDFERTSLWTRIKLKYLTVNFLGTIIFKVFRFVLLLGISYVILFPFFTKIAASFMSPEDFVDVTVKLIPKYPTLNTYKQIILENQYFKAMFNTACLSLFCAIIQTLICSFIGYGFAKYKFKGSSLLFMAVIFTMVVPHQTLKYAIFSNFKYFDIGISEFGILKLFGMPAGIDLINTYWPLFILSVTGLAFKNGLYIFLMRQFFRGVPNELEESAYIDGSGMFKTFVRIILPLSIPMMITIFLFAFSWQWTDYFYSELFFPGNAQVLLPKIVEIPKALKDTLPSGYPATDLFNSAVNNTCGLLILLPLLVVYLFCQRYLIQGIERSGITG